MKITEKNVNYYTDEHLAKIAFPLGGTGSGMFCMEGTGALSKFSVRHAPDVPNAPNIFAALTVKGERNISRVLEGPVPRYKISHKDEYGNGLGGYNYGLPRFLGCRFHARFPFAHVALSDDTMPVTAEITGFSPFIPGDTYNSCLPCATLAYTLTNKSDAAVDSVFYFASSNFMGKRTDTDRVLPTPDGKGFIMSQDGSTEKPWHEGYFLITTDHPDTAVDTAWFRGGWFDTFTMLWNGIEAANCENRRFTDPADRSQGGTLAVPLRLAPGESQTIRVHFCWYVPHSDLRTGKSEEKKEGCCGDESGCDCVPDRFIPWYAAAFPAGDCGCGGCDTTDQTAGLLAIYRYYTERFESLYAASKKFSDTLFASEVPPALLEAVSANLSILKSPTLMRQHDGRLWGWEGCCATVGCCPGTCTHVWNYAQAICHLFPEFERGIRMTEFMEGQDGKGHQQFRVPLPVQPAAHDFHAAADGQLGGIMKAYRDWRIAGDTAWLAKLWPHIKQSLTYCIKLWDPNHEGVIRQSHHNTYDIEFFGPEPMCTTMYLGALKAAEVMAAAMQDGEAETFYKKLREKGGQYVKEKLFNGTYLVQENDFGLTPGEMPGASFDKPLSAEAMALIKKEGPKYQYGDGCLSDGVIGAWMASLFGLGDVMDPAPIRNHLQSIYKYNYKTDLRYHANTQRPGYALGDDGGLLLCTWPEGAKKPSLPFVYSDEVWTGIEYQVASHMLCEGMVEEGLNIVKTCRARYDGTVRNPFDEYECGHWYARALASFALLQSYTGARYDKLTGTLYVRASAKGDAYAILCADGGYGLAGVKDGKPFFELIAGKIDVKNIVEG